jgi:hypothetical protein
MVSGSPKLNVYETDLWWGKFKKSDAVHHDSVWFDFCLIVQIVEA